MHVRRLALVSMVALAALAVSACTCTSEGLELKPDRESRRAAVSLEWRSNDDVSGTMTASVSDGRLFSGPYFEITPETQIDQLKPLWEGWAEGHGWRYWQPGPGFVKHYGGEVLANLTAPNGERMRCRLRKVSHSPGMSGGGEGVCQLIDGITADAAFPPVPRGKY